MKLNSLSKFSQRLIVSSICIGFLFVLINLSFHPFFQYLFIGSVASIVGVALWEFYQIANVKGYDPVSHLGIGGGSLLVLSVYLSLSLEKGVILTPVLLVTLLLFTFLSLFTRKSDPHPMGNLAITLFGVLYLALPLSCIIAINYYFFPSGPQDGRLWLLYALALTKMTDTGAYFTGKLIGKRPLATDLSPKKTVEGAIGGILSSTCAGVMIPFFYSTFFPSSSFVLPIFYQLLLGLSVGVLAQVGDLAESPLKRDAGVKDSNQLPGLGGILDMVDSLIFTLPLFYLFLFMQYS